MIEIRTLDDNNPIMRRSFLLGAGTALAASLTPAGPAQAQAQQSAPAAAPPKPTVMVLGSPHIGGSSGNHAFEMRSPVLDLLRRCNDPAVVRRDHSAYLLLAHLRIYANLVRIIEAANDRVLVVFGSGHVTLLSQFLRDSDLYEVESPLAYLA